MEKIEKMVNEVQKMIKEENQLTHDALLTLYPESYKYVNRQGVIDEGIMCLFYYGFAMGRKQALEELQ